jgi:hypothetical protein
MREAIMSALPRSIHYHAVAMELAAYLDDRYVEMRILTHTGTTIVVVCDRDSIFSVQRHIEQMGRACPEILTWSASQDSGSAPNSPHGSDPRT